MHRQRAVRLNVLIGHVSQVAPGVPPAPRMACARASPASSGAPLGLRICLPPRPQARRQQARAAGAAAGARQSASSGHAGAKPPARGSSPAAGSAVLSAANSPSPTPRSADPPACPALPLPAAAVEPGGAGGAGAWASSEPRAGGLPRARAAVGSPDPWPSTASVPAAACSPAPAAAAAGQPGGSAAAGGAAGTPARPQASGFLGFMDARGTPGAPPLAATAAHGQPGASTPLSASPCTTASAAASEEVVGAMRAPAPPWADGRARRRTQVTARKRCGLGRVALAARPLAAPNPAAAGPSEQGGGAPAQPGALPALNPGAEGPSDQGGDAPAEPGTLPALDPGSAGPAEQGGDAPAEPGTLPALDPAELRQSPAATDSSHMAPRPLVTGAAQARHPAISANACSDVVCVSSLSASNLAACTASNTCCSCSPPHSQ